MLKSLLMIFLQDRCDWPGNTDCQAGGPTAKPKPVTTPRPQAPVQTNPPPRPTTVAPVQNTQFVTPSQSFGTTTYRPGRYSTTPTPTKDPEWCRLNWCPTPKPLPPNKHEPINVPDSDYKVVCYFTNWAWYRYVFYVYANSLASNTGILIAFTV